MPELRVGLAGSKARTRHRTAYAISGSVLPDVTYEFGDSGQHKLCFERSEIMASVKLLQIMHPATTDAEVYINNMIMAQPSRDVSRHSQDTLKTLSRHSQDTLKTLSRH